MEPAPQVAIEADSVQPRRVSAAESSSLDRRDQGGPDRRQLGGYGLDPADLVVLPDDPDEMLQAIEHDGRPFNGAVIPLAIHQPELAERSFDACEWAGELIRGAGGGFLVVSPCAGSLVTPDGGDEIDALDQAPAVPSEVALSTREWNHTVAMLERVAEVCRRFGLDIGVGESRGLVEIGLGEALADQQLFPYVLDTGRYLLDGLLPTRLVSPVEPTIAGRARGRGEG